MLYFLEYNEVILCHTLYCSRIHSGFCPLLQCFSSLVVWTVRERWSRQGNYWERITVHYGWIAVTIGCERLRVVVSELFCTSSIPYVEQYFSHSPFQTILRRCGTSTSLAPEFESAAKELNGKVQFVKLDTDNEEAMATRLNIMDTPTLIFYDFADGTKATLKGRSEGKITKEKILELCELYFPTRTVSQPTIVDEGINKPTGEKREFWWG